MHDRDGYMPPDNNNRLKQQGFTMSEDEIVAALSVLTWNLRPEQTFADSLQRDADGVRRAHVQDIGKLYRAMLRDAAGRTSPPPPVSRSAARDRDAQVSRI